PSILDLLQVNGIETVDFQTHQTADPGLLFTDGVSAEVLEIVAALSANGITRLLVLGMGHDSLKSGALWPLLSAGASDVLIWDWSADSCANISSRLLRWKEVDLLTHTAAVAERLVGKSSKWIITLRNIVEMARFTTASILITGESGTGKELVA